MASARKVMTTVFWDYDGTVMAVWKTNLTRSTILLQQNPSFGETLDQMHFTCKKLLKSDKI